MQGRLTIKTQYYIATSVDEFVCVFCLCNNKVTIKCLFSVRGTSEIAVSRCIMNNFKVMFYIHSFSALPLFIVNKRTKCTCKYVSSILL